MKVNAKLAHSLGHIISPCVATGVILSVAATFPRPVQAEVVYSGVAAGDASTNSAIIWTRATDTNQPNTTISLTAQISTDVNFSTIQYTSKGTTDANKDFTWKTEVKGLESGTQYYYRFVTSNGEISPVGRFKTVPARNQKIAVRFGFSGDADGKWRPYPSTQNFDQLNLDFFIFLGDIIYETSTAVSAGTADPYTNPSQALKDYHRKYRENLEPVTTGGFSGLQKLFAASGNYTLLDNHELGNKQFINGGAPTGSPAGAGADATDTANDVNTTGAYINQTTGFKTLLQAYSNYQPIRERTISAPSDSRTDGTQLLYFAQQWGANSIFINLDDRSYRDIRMKTSSGDDDTGTRANNPNRTMLGKTQLAWLKRTLLLAKSNGITWKIIAVSSPIDELGNGNDGGKSWIGGYKAERNEILKFIADNNIENVVFLSTDDHQSRVNELTYFTDINNSSTRTIVPKTFTIVAGPIGAGGPDAITNHTFTYIKSLADNLANSQSNSGVNPIGLDSSFTGLQNVYREGDSQADSLRQPVDFFSPDTFNYVTLDISTDGKTLSVNAYGINSYQSNTFPEPDPTNNPVRRIFGFQIQNQ